MGGGVDVDMPGTGAALAATLAAPCRRAYCTTHVRVEIVRSRCACQLVFRDMVDYVLIIRLLAIRCQEPHALTVHRLLRIRMAALPVALRVAYEPGRRIRQRRASFMLKALVILPPGHRPIASSVPPPCCRSFARPFAL